MKRIVGIMLSTIGILLLIKPEFNLFESLETMIYLICTYWPLCIIYLGFYIQNSSSSKKRR